jgi:hypothetical protein
VFNTFPNVGFDLPDFFFFKIVPVRKNNSNQGEQPNQVVFFIVENILKDKLAGAGNKSDPAPNNEVNAIVGDILFCFGDHGLDKPEAFLRRKIFFGHDGFIKW